MTARSRSSSADRLREPCLRAISRARTGKIAVLDATWLAILVTPHFELFAKWACGPIFCDRSKGDGGHTRQGEATDAGDSTEGRGRASGHRGARGRAHQP